LRPRKCGVPDGISRGGTGGFFFPRVTVTAATAGIVAVALYQYDISAQRQKLAQSVVVVASQPMPSVEALKNFDAIQRMGQSARPDEDLLALASDMK
jgi:hypothetical protein